MNFKALAETLNKSMMSDHVCVSKDRNPVFIAKNKMLPDQLACVLGQYTLFTKNVVHFLYAARNTARLAKWKSVDVELTRNLGEELGTETECITHNNMLILGIKETVGVDLSTIVSNEATKIFIDKMTAIMSDKKVSYASGAAYALECSAIPELRIVIELVKDLANMKTGSAKLSNRLQSFFDDHLNVWEVAHESYLKEACRNYIDENNALEFQSGFEAVMETMDEWWLGLKEESDFL
ncbi:MAG: DUF3865 domain-containing protein [Candidatus Aenigmarchaeota archaeon]|nr:DUF3865 domain-containing protein [Candidatus Aenigmarchaeota archaeon]